MKRTGVIVVMVWLGLLLGLAFSLPSARSAPPAVNAAVPQAWVGEALDAMPFITNGRR